MKLKKKNKLVLYMLLPYLLLFMWAMIEMVNSPTNENKILLSLTVLTLFVVAIFLCRIILRTRKDEKQ